MAYNILDVIGWTGSILLGLCGIPQAYKSWRTKKADDVSTWFLLMWIVGEVLILIYVFPTFQWPLIINYLLNLVSAGIILRYKVVSYEKTSL